MEISCSSDCVNAFFQGGASKVIVVERRRHGAPQGFDIKVPFATVLNPRQLYGVIKAGSSIGFDFSAYDWRLNLVFRKRN